MELDTVKNQTTWNDAAGSINTNFSKIKIAVDNLQKGGGDKTMVFSQSPASSEWVIEHNLGKFPSVTVVDSSGTVVYGDVFYISESKVVIKFSAAFIGKAYLN